MKPHIILSHGLDSSPAATKVNAHVDYLAQAFAQFLRAL